MSVGLSIGLSVTHGFQSFFDRGVDVINITVEFLIYDSLNCDATAAALRDYGKDKEHVGHVG